MKLTTIYIISIIVGAGLGVILIGGILEYTSIEEIYKSFFMLMGGMVGGSFLGMIASLIYGRRLIKNEKPIQNNRRES